MFFFYISSLVGFHPSLIKSCLRLHRLYSSTIRCFCADYLFWHVNLPKSVYLGLGGYFYVFNVQGKMHNMPVNHQSSHHDLLQFHCLITTNHHIMILTHSSSMNQVPLSLTINHHQYHVSHAKQWWVETTPSRILPITMFDHVFLIIYIYN